MEFEPGSDLLFYEGLHGAVVTDKVNVAQYADLKIGVVPVINLEWIQKMHRDRRLTRLHHRSNDRHGAAPYARLHQVHLSAVLPNGHQFPARAHGRTSNPFIARWIPTPDESMVVIRFRDPHGIDFPYLLSMIHGSFMSRANSIVIPGGKLEIAMQLILTPMILKLVERRRRAIRS